MQHSPRIAFVTTCKGRAQHIEKTLPKNLYYNSGYPNAKFFILNYGSPDHLLSYLETNHQRELDNERLVIYSFSEPGPFRMAHAKNIVHRVAIMEGAEILVNVDADNFTGPDFAGYIAEKFQAGENVFLWAKMIQEGKDRLPRGINGRIAVSTRAFLNAGGYDEKYSTWAPDDKDFNARLRRLGYAGIEIDRRFLEEVVLHSDRMRFKEYPQARTDMGEDQFELANDADTTVVNFGDLGCGVVYRNFDPEPIELSHVPTRIFGIGMHKTATTSLHAALNILGFDSAHWKSAHWAKAIWTEMNVFGRSLTLEKHYALSDLPITILYDKLDKAYPGSKFILTKRNEEKWLNSVRRHWSPDYNRFRLEWNTDPFTHTIHKAVYGQKGFNEEVFLERYRRHNAEVQQYFSSRPDDLLVMDMDDGAGWKELCGFLGEPIPEVPYPKTFVTWRTT